VVEDLVQKSHTPTGARTGTAALEAIIVAYKFTIGQIVDLAPNMFRAAASGQYEIRRLMPASDRDGADPSYRIKSADEKHERVASESELTLSEGSEPLFS